MLWQKRVQLLLGCLGIAVVWSLGLAVLPAWSKVIYVRPAGGPNNPCTSSNNMTTPLSGFAALASCIAAGDTVILKDGTYNESMYDIIPAGLSQSQPTTIQAQNKRQAVLTTVVPGLSWMIVMGVNANPDCTGGSSRPYVKIDGLKFQIGLTQAGGSIVSWGPCQGAYGTPWQVHDITFVNNEILGGCNTYSTSSFSTGLGQAGNSGQWTVTGNWIHDIGMVECDGSTPVGTNGYQAFSYAIYMSGGDNLVDGNEFGPNVSGYGIHGYSTGNHLQNNIFSNNYFHDLVGPAMIMCGSNNQFYNNIIANVGSSPYNSSYEGGLLLNGSCSGVQTNNNYIYNNTFTRNKQGGSGYNACIDLASSGANNNVIKNNICWGNGNGDTLIVNRGGSGNTFGNNLCGDGGASGCNTYSSPSGASIFTATLPAVGVPPTTILSTCATGASTTPNCSGQGIVATNFQLSSTSPAINQGVSTASGTPTFTTDFGGNARISGGAQDQGAWESGGTPPPPQTHLACNGTTCVSMSGGGPDTCTPQGSACGGPPPAAFTALHWPMDDCSNCATCSSTTVADTSGNNVTGTFSSSPAPIWITGHSGPGCALRLQDTSTLVNNPTVTWAANQPVSVTFWILAHPCSGGGCGTFNVGGNPKDDVNSFGAFVPWADAQNTLYFDYGNPGGGGAGRIGTSFAAYMGKWTFVALVSDGSSFKAIYLNGSSVASGTTASAPTVTLTGVTLGTLAGSFFANADIDDFQIVNRVLSQAEITQMYGTTRRSGRHATSESLH